MSPINWFNLGFFCVALLCLVPGSGIAHFSNPTVNHTSMTDSNSQTPTSDSGADLILTNGDIYTGDPNRPRAEALAVREETIIAVGSNDEINRLRNSKTRVIDLHNQFAMPGFNDAHVHLAGAGLAKLSVDLEGAKSLAEMQARIRARLKDFKPGEWMYGRGWDHTLWPDKNFPTRADLDVISRDHPMFFLRVDGHVAVVNSRALEIAAITRATPDPPGGKFMHDPATGEPNGMLEEDSAMDRVNKLIPPFTPDQRRRAIVMALAEASSFGVTSIQDNSEAPLFTRYEEFVDGRSRDGKSAPPAPAAVDLPIYISLHREGKLPLRITEWLPFNAPLALLEELRRTFGTADAWIKTGALKGFLDGSLGSRTAAMLAPYSDDAATSGILRADPDQVKQMAIARDAAGFQIAFHAIGDRANRLALDTFAAVREANGARDRRDRVEHAQILALSDIPRFAALGVIASMQPCHLLDDERWAESRIGSERIKGGYAWNTLEKSGAHLAFGTDYPVESVNPLRGIYACATRELPGGGPAGGWQPQEKLPIETCIREYTAGAAHAEFEENRKGKLVPGMFADIVVFPSDITRLTPLALINAKVALTVAGGKIVYDSSQTTAAPSFRTK
ncbi:MAG: amidohydrolase [Candidatus Acidiferrales bacterium]